MNTPTAAPYFPAPGFDVAPGASFAALSSPWAGRLQPLQKAAYFAALVYTFVIYARIPELALATLGVNLYMIMILTPVALALCVASGGLFRAIYTPVAAYFLFFTFWLILATPFGYWRGGSIDVVMAYLKTSLPAFFILAGCLWTLPQCRGAMKVLGLAEIFLSLLVLFWGQDAAGRLGLLFGTLANQNDLAAFLIMGLPFYLLMAESRGSPLTRILAIAGGIPICVVIVKSGSRMGLIALVVVLFAYFVGQSLGLKAILLSGSLLFAPLIYYALPQASVDRYKTLMGSEDQITSEAELSALESRTQRARLFMKSIAITIHHPLLGVGPGNFAPYTSTTPSDRSSLRWHQTHNSFTQASSEAGIPAMFAYAAVMLYSMLAPFRIYRRAKRIPSLAAVSRMAFALYASMLGFTVCAFFGNYAYSFQLPLLAGLVMAFVQAAREQMRASQWESRLAA